MNMMHEYWVPDYYEQFACKGGKCRSVCCKGWPVSVSMGEYYRMIGMECSPELRRKMDCAFHVAEHPTEDRYAQITPNWLGDCPLHMENGYCRLQVECGEQAIPTICRVYPRGAREMDGVCECSCSNSCEAVLELLFRHEEPLRFYRKNIVGAPPEQPVFVPEFVGTQGSAIRKLCLVAMQDSTQPLQQRIRRIGRYLHTLHRAFVQESESAIADALQACACMEALSEASGDPIIAEQMQYRLVTVIGLQSRSTEVYAQQALAALGMTADESQIDWKTTVQNYALAARRFEEKAPQWEHRFENMLANHMYYTAFPFSDRFENIAEEYLSLAAVYAFLRFLLIGCETPDSTESSRVDICAAAFRVIDHSAFARNSAHVLEAMKRSRLEDVDQLLLV